MKIGTELSFLVIFALLLGTAQVWGADPVTHTSKSEITSEASIPTRVWTIEINATSLGNYNENTFKSSSDLAGADGAYSDLGLDLAFRRALSQTISTGLRIPIFAYLSSNRAQQFSSHAFIMPVMWTGRYSVSKLLDQSFFNPWIEVEGGMTLINETVYSTNEEFLRPSFRASIGFDIRPWEQSGFFTCARFSYLAVSDFSNYQMGIGSGFSF